jgi:two-component system nitrate/nitrite response regulator NarL
LARGADRLEGSRCFDGLTAREQQITILIAEGLPNKEIARLINVAEGTVKMHLHNIYVKLAVSNRTALAVFATAYRQQAAVLAF